MSKMEFVKFVNTMVDMYGVASYLNNADDIVDECYWCDCPYCFDPILYDDWKDDEELKNGCCPICGERLVDA